jgi:hypothetical protein
MVSARRFVSFASTTPSLATSECVTFLLFGFRSLLGLGKSTGIYKTGSVIANPDAQGEYIDLPSFARCEWHRLEVQKEVLWCVGEEGDQHADCGDRELRYWKVLAQHFSVFSCLNEQGWEAGKALSWTCCLSGSVDGRVWLCWLTCALARGIDM